jgi:3-phosphoglycerate kinase
MKKKSLKDVDVKAKLVFLRNDFNVPLDEKGRITDDTRIRAALPTFKYLVDQGARIVCASHLGRPKGERKPALSLRPVAERLPELINRDVIFTGETTGAEVEKVKSELKEADVLLLENLRFDPGETKNDETLARELARGIDAYINDAFGACHRAHASIARITEFVPCAAAGLLVEKEINYLSLATENPPDDYVVILGGAKVSDKIPLIANLIDKASTILIGGAMAYTFLKTRGVAVGRSRVEEDFLQECAGLLKAAEEKKVNILLPVDHIAAVEVEEDVTIRMVKAGETIPDNMMGLDIGMETVKRYTDEIKKAKLIVWNGPMGVFEIRNFSGGTTEIARAVAAAAATSIVGGGDSVSALNQAGVADRISHISTGGGASLEFLAGKKLPGIEALTEAA